MKIRSPLLTNLAARLAVSLGRMLFLTLRGDFPRTMGGAYEKSPPENFVFLTWHESLLPPILSGRIRNTVALISQHQDGSYLAAAMQQLRIRPVRGSSSRGGSRALRELLQTTGGKHVLLTPDGPRGPRQEMKPGAIFLAGRTGRSIVCCGVAFENPWIIRGSWTDLIIPKPFSRYVMRLSEPIPIPESPRRPELNALNEKVQQIMQETYRISEQVLKGEEQSNPTQESQIRRAA